MSIHLWAAGGLVSPYTKSLKHANVRRRMEPSRR